MADCKIVNANVKTAVTNINTIAGKYKTAGTTFETDFKAAIADMEGDAKDALIGLSKLLEGNRSNFESVDSKIAASIRGNK